MQDLQPVADILIVEAAAALRNNSSLPRIVNRSLDSAAAQKNKHIDVPIWHALTVEDVTPGVPKAADDLEPEVVQVKLDQWKKVKFPMSDKEIAEVQDNRVVPENTLRAAIALSDNVNNYILADMYQHSFLTVAASAPADENDMIDCKTALNGENVPRDIFRHMVISNDIEGELSKAKVLLEADKRGDQMGLIEGEIGRKFGFNFHGNNLMPSHMQGDGATWTVSAITTAKPSLSGGTSLVPVTAGTGSFNAGDTITFAGHAQQYAVVADISASGNMEIAPTLRQDLGASEAITLDASSADHAVGGMGFHQNAYAFASRPLQQSTTPGAIVSSVVDTLSGLVLRMTVNYIEHQLQWSIDVLYGGKVILPEALVRLTD